MKVTLPSLFRGVVNVKNNDGFCQKSQARYCRAFRERMRRGLIRLDASVLDDDDEVYIHAQGNIELRLMPSTEDDVCGKIRSRVGSHVRRIFRRRAT